MSGMEYCFVSTMACKKAECPVYHEASQQCKIVMAINRYLGNIDGADSTKTWKASTQPAPSQPLSNAMRPSGLPDMSQIKWLIKGNVDARDTDPFAYAFVFKYDRDAKKATDELRFESAELYNYLKENENTLVLDGFTYSLNKEGSLFGRNKARD